MKIYGPTVEDDYASFYDMAHSLPGVHYEGSLPQHRLAEEMANVDIWAYPCTFEETSCISAMEAMASGTLLISKALGALPETTAGFANLLTSQETQTTGKSATSFANYVGDIATAALTDKETTLKERERQIDYVRQNYTWEKRAHEWIKWLEQII
jgi:glycosyltransferase involved in cell wall biosynthesis